MRELKTEISQLKRDYKSLRYPGDLSQHVRLETPAHPGMRLRGFLSAAAAILLAITTWMLLPGKSRTPVVVETAPADAVTHVQIVAARIEEPVLVIEEKTPAVSEHVRVIESPFAVQLPTALMPAGTYGSVSAPAWDNVPSRLSTEWIGMPQQTLSVPNVSEIDATLVSTEPAS